MKVYSTYRREEPNTINGETIVVITRYTSFNKDYMDKLENNFAETFKSGILMEVEEDNE